MGVKGLWKLLESVGRPVTLESLENKILGVDASVILNQAVKGMRDTQGNPVPNAHLVGLFSRLCKLLYYRIKPVFVFDGGVPHLKKKTLAARKEQRFKAVHKSKRAAEKIIKNYLKAKALETVTKRKSSAVPVRSRSPREPDVFELPPLPSSAVTDAKSSSEDEDMDIPILEQFQRQHLEETFQDPKAIDIDSEEFKALPPEIQHELIKDIREEKTWMSKNILPGQARDFSSFQLEGVLKRGKMNQRLEDLRKEMNQRNSGELTGIVSDETVGEENTVNSQKILSEDTAHYILIKRNEQEVKQSKDFSDEGGFFREDQEGEIVTWTNPRPKPVSPTKVPSFEIHDLCSSDSEILSPFLDVPEADLSPSNSQAQRGSFSFSPIKDKGRIENDELSIGENVTKITEAPIQKSQTYHTPFSGSEDAKSVDKKSKIDNLHDLSDHEAQVVFFGEDSDEDNELLTQIKDKKKELEDLLRKWKASKHQKTADDVITPSKDDHNVAEVNEIELRERSPESVEVFDVSERKPECYVIEETENTPSTLIIDDQTESKEKTVDTLHVCESESGTSSAEDIRVAVKSDEGLSENLKISSSDTLQETRTSNPSFNIAEEEKRTLSTDSSPEIQILPSPNGDTASDVIEDEKVPSSLDVQPEGQTTQSEDTTADTNQDPDIEVTQIVEKQDSAEKSGDRMDVGEPVPGPSGLPVEWQGATVEELEDIRLNIEAEQHSLASEQARQNRIAASLSNEMFAECQELLQLFGVPYLVSPMEAEAQCATLDIVGLTEGSITDDSDIFLFGGRRVYKNIFNQNKHVEMYGSDSVLRNLALDRSNLICIAFITGSDYTEGVPGVGTVGAMELLHEFSGEGLDGLKKFKSWHEEVQKRTKHPQETKVKRKMRSVELPNDFPAEEVYEAYLHPVVDESTEQFEWGKPDLHSLRLFASDKFGWSSSRTDEVLLPVLKQLNKDETQMKINNYFEVKFQETRTVKSKRVQRVLNRKFNPSSSNSEDGVENSEKQRQHGGETPSKKKNDKTEPNERKRTLSTKNSASKHDNEADAKRAKKSVDGDSACALTETRSSGRKRGRGRGKARERAEANADLRLSVAPRSSNQVKRKQLYQENKERSRRTRSRSSTSADTEKETFVDQIIENDKKRKKQQRSAVSKKKNDAKCIAEDDDSTSDTTDSEDNSENFYAGPKPVSVFVRGRGRASIWPTGRALRRGK